LIAGTVLVALVSVYGTKWLRRAVLG